MLFFPKFTKLIKYELCNLYKIPNKTLKFLFFSIFTNSTKVQKYFGSFDSILYNRSLFCMSDSDSLYFSVYGKIL